MSRRNAWLSAVKSRDFPVSLRLVRGTLLCMPVNTDGTVTASDDEVAEQVGLPRRTVQRHVEKAVSGGWLLRVNRGGHGHRVRMLVTVPECAISGALPSVGVRHFLGHSDQPGVRHLVAHINKKRANGREREALVERRQRRDDHVGHRASTTTWRKIFSTNTTHSSVLLGSPLGLAVAS